MLISKLPKKIDSVTHNSRENNREFLTKPASWAKLGVVLVVVLMLVWINLKSDHKDHVKSNAKTNDKTGIVAGVSSLRAEVEEKPKSENSPPVKIDKPAPQNNVPTSTQTAIEKIIGNASDLKTLLTAGKGFLDQNRLDEAKLAFERATEVAPNYRDIWYLLGYTELKKYQQNPSQINDTTTISALDRAIIALTRANALDPQAQNVKDLLEFAKGLKIK